MQARDKVVEMKTRSGMVLRYFGRRAFARQHAMQAHPDPKVRRSWQDCNGRALALTSQWRSTVAFHFGARLGLIEQGW